MNGEGTRVLDISWGSIVKIAVATFIVYLIFILKDILVWVLFGVIISILFEPAIDFFHKRRIPRVVSTVVVYFVLFGVFAYTIFLTTDILVDELLEFSSRLPQYFNEQISPYLQGLGIAAFSDFQSFIEAIGQSATGNTSNVAKALFSIFGGIFSTVFVISVAMFLSIEEKPIERMLSLLFPKKYEAIALDIWGRSQQQVSRWFLSRVLSSIFIAVTTYVALILFNVDYPFSLSIIAGILNFIPIIGPLLTAIAVGLIIVLESPLRALFVILALTLIQQIEGNILTPLLTKRFTGLSPTLVLIALAIGGQFWGVMGAILAIPLAGIIFEFLRDFLKKRKEQQEEPVIL